jgi:hypothetical protein
MVRAQIDRVIAAFNADPAVRALRPDIAQAVLDGTTTPGHAADRLLRATNAHDI